MTTKQLTQRNELLTTAHRNYGKALNEHAFFRVHNRSTSEDMVQDTFLKTWSYLVRGGKIELMKSFLYHVLNDLIIDGYRKHKTSSLDVMIENGFEPATDGAERIVDIMDGKAAVLLIQRLPEKYRKVMRMRYVQDMSLEEISLLTQQTRNTVAVQIHRGLKHLREMYKQG
jgi:RNA polymerase sigma-70 factor, ECF subfamily